jgi:hypothetical protein
MVASQTQFTQSCLKVGWNFAKILDLKMKNDSIRLGFIISDNEIDHCFCHDSDYFSDISGQQSKKQFLDKWLMDGECLMDADFEELELNCDESYDYLAESIIDEYIKIYLTEK